MDGAPVPYVVMELVNGVPLAARLARDGVLPWREAVTVCVQVTSALAAAHSRGAVHRDVTPGNVMLTHGGAKVVDFGISALAENDVGPEGTLLGTPGYVAPERINGGQVSPATDVYSVGLLLYRMLTGRLPWQVGSVTQMLRAHLHADPGPLPPVSGLPAEVAELCRRVWRKIRFSGPAPRTWRGGSRTPSAWRCRWRWSRVVTIVDRREDRLAVGGDHRRVAGAGAAPALARPAADRPGGEHRGGAGRGDRAAVAERPSERPTERPLTPR